MSSPSETKLCPFCGATVLPTDRPEWFSLKHKLDCFIVQFADSINPFIHSRILKAWNTRAAPSNQFNAGLEVAAKECECLLESQIERTSSAGAGCRVAIRACIAAIRARIGAAKPTNEEVK